MGVTCFGPPHDLKTGRTRETPKCARCYHVRVTCNDGEAPKAPSIDPPADATVEAMPPVLRSKRSAEVAMDIDDPVSSKAAKPASGSTAGSSVRVGSSTASAAISSVDFTSLTPRPRPHPRPRPVAASMSISSSSSSVDNSDELLLVIRQVRNAVQSTAADINSQVAIFLADAYRALDDLEDKVRAARSLH